MPVGGIAESTRFRGLDRRAMVGAQEHRDLTHHCPWLCDGVDLNVALPYPQSTRDEYPNRSTGSAFVHDSLARFEFDLR